MTTNADAGAAAATTAAAPAAAPAVAAGGGAPVSLTHLSRHFGAVRALDGLTVDVAPGELVALLGPSGCGKTTALRILAGFETADSGTVTVDGKEISHIPASRRDMGMVFQSYSLFPNMSALDNVGFGLRLRKKSAAERKRRAGELLDMVGLAKQAGQYPHQLSGGQQQRVALARALVNRPRALLLDEPLAALDLKLRQAMQIELKRIQREVGITFIFVTHDQNEALTMSDRLVVMNAGRIEQLGAPREVYEHPRTRFVAGFIGTSNLITGTVERMDGGTAVIATPADEELTAPDADAAGAAVGQPLDMTVRPEKIMITRGRPDAGRCAIRGRVSEVVYLGTSTQYAVKTADGSDLLVFLQNSSDSEDIAARDQDVWLSWRPEHTLALAQGGPSAPIAEEEL